MKSILGLMLFSVLVCCTSKKSQEASVQDSVSIDTTSLSEDLVELPEPPPAPEPIILSDSSARVLNDMVEAQFDTLYRALTDSSKYYQVVLEDYYDEYEGQDEKKTIEWYFTKELSVVYAKYTFESGSLDQPEVTEYILTDNRILYVKNESELYGPDNGRAFIKWSSQVGGVKLNWSEYWKEVKSVDPIPDDYLKTIQLEWETNMNLLIGTISKEEPTGDEDIYSIDIQVPKHAELVDYTKVTIPKQVYNKLRE
jgi:hypothetical protein